ncbi:hypothetical protein LZD38_00995 [Streptococcus gallolyticus]|uniref:hypothetical protein n=1 Tax=Streptococcus gallolyticus TaxID=315405 RepID=UPI001F382C45|nr:hypothetical protein [Streptococcus gallolyticus]MCF1633338.1 hypothetical protein [Streptococcus gallolyticus]
MNEFNLVNIISDIISFGDEENYVQNIKVFLIRMTKSKNEIYKLEADDKTKELLFSSLKEELDKSAFKNRDIMNYDTLITKKNTHELVDVRQYKNIQEVLSDFDDENKYLVTTKGLDETKFTMYMVNLKTSKGDYKIFSKFSNVFELSKKYLFGQFLNRGNLKDSTFTLSEKDNVIGFNKKIELLVVDDNYVLINAAEAKFDSLFKMNALFSTKAGEILENNDKIKSIFNEETIEVLKEKVKSGKRMASRLIKITSDEDRFNKTIDNISKIEDIINDKNHKFHNKVKDVVYKDGKLSVPEGEEVQLLNAISDAFYQVIFSETVNVDETRM